MGATQDSNDLSLEQIQALLFDKQRQLTERKLVRVVQAQEQDWLAAPQGIPADNQSSRPSRSPESWRGADGHDRFFRPTVIAPLDAPLAPMSAHINHATEPVATSGVAPKRYTWRDRLLLISEIVALAAFLTILGASFRRMRDLNNEYQQAQRARVAEQISVPTQIAEVLSPTLATVSVTPSRQPTSTPPTIQTATAPAQVAQPGTALGTTSVASATVTAEASPVPLVTNEPTPSAWPTATPTLTPIELPGVRPSQSETPEILRPPTAAPTSEATPEPGLPLRIEIAAIEVDAPVVQGDTWEPLKLGVGHRVGSALPGEVGNVVMSAHNDIYGEIFRQLHKVEPGDEILLYTSGDTWRYTVISVEIVSPLRVDLMDPTDTPILTLITCYPYLLDTHRVVVRAALAP